EDDQEHGHRSRHRAISSPGTRNFLSNESLIRPTGLRLLRNFTRITKNRCYVADELKEVRGSSRAIPVKQTWCVNSFEPKREVYVLNLHGNKFFLLQSLRCFRFYIFGVHRQLGPHHDDALCFV